MLVSAKNAGFLIYLFKQNVFRFLDRFRTMTNVMGDALGCAVVQSMCAAELEQMDREKEGEQEGAGGEKIDIEMEAV